MVAVASAASRPARCPLDSVQQVTVCLPVPASITLGLAANEQCYREEEKEDVKEREREVHQRKRRQVSVCVFAQEKTTITKTSTFRAT